MQGPARVRVHKEETLLAESVTLVCWRIEATLAIGRNACGWALAMPVAVRHVSAHGRVTRPIVDLHVVLGGMAAAASVVLLRLLIGERKRRHDKRI